MFNPTKSLSGSSTSMLQRLVVKRATAGATGRPGRSMRVVVRASREAQLAELEAMRTGLREQLEHSATQLSSSTPASTAVPAPKKAAAPLPAAADDADALPRKELTEVGQDTFHAALQAAGNKLVVVDCFTDWCGPCKMILPTLEQWNHELEGTVELLKFNCNKANKELGQSLGIKVAPTFILYKGQQEVARMTGAKADQLRALIDEHR